MALGENNSGVFLSVKDGKICQNFKQPGQGLVEMKKNDGTLFWQKQYSFISGIITGIDIVENKFFKVPSNDVVLTIVDGNESYKLQFGLSSRYASSFFKALPNCDINQPIKITPWQKVVDGGKKSAIFLNQGNEQESKKWFWSQDQMPPIDKIEVPGKAPIYNDHKQNVFFWNYVTANILPKMNNGAGYIAKTPGKKQEATQQQSTVSGTTYQQPAQQGGYQYGGQQPQSATPVQNFDQGFSAGATENEVPF